MLSYRTQDHALSIMALAFILSKPLSPPPPQAPSPTPTSRLLSRRLHHHHYRHRTNGLFLTTSPLRPNSFMHGMGRWGYIGGLRWICNKGRSKIRTAFPSTLLRPARLRHGRFVEPASSTGSSAYYVLRCTPCLCPGTSTSVPDHHVRPYLAPSARRNRQHQFATIHSRNAFETTPWPLPPVHTTKGPTPRQSSPQTSPTSDI
ncbi:hypothetical protein BKA70DRAFT_727883 [Coprinopsis sp. MPI-PUGE-AT-0042]|nr:hypothetical protein BKA70DRAFT_727883 [Coprinopsis sp. MPI-PUGE-AT-0042]